MNADPDCSGCISVQSFRDYGASGSASAAGTSGPDAKELHEPEIGWGFEESHTF